MVSLYLGAGHSLTLLTSHWNSFLSECLCLLEEALILVLPSFMLGSLCVPAKRQLRLQLCLPSRHIPLLLNPKKLVMVDMCFPERCFYSPLSPPPAL